jgi:uncharacterized protein
MKRQLLEILACPVCRSSPLELVVFEEKEGEIIEGVLRCVGCGIDYLIKESIPNMLPPESR